MKLKEILDKETYSKIVDLIGEEAKDELEEMDVKAKMVTYDRFKTVNETLKSTATELKDLKVKGAFTQADLDKIKAEALKEKEQEIKTIKVDYAIENSLKQNKIVGDKYVSLIKGLINKEEIEEDENGAFKGLNEQIQSLKNEYGVLFNSDDTQTENKVETKPDALGKNNVNPANLKNVDPLIQEYLKLSGRNLQDFEATTNTITSNEK